jgi:site-specific recombinase XerD
VRLRSSRRSESTLTAYRIALDDLIAWLADHGGEREAFGEQRLATYLAGYRRRMQPAAATYYRRFALLRRFYRWLSGSRLRTGPVRGA